MFTNSSIRRTTSAKREQDLVDSDSEQELCSLTLPKVLPKTKIVNQSKVHHHQYYSMPTEPEEPIIKTKKRRRIYVRRPKWLDQIRKINNNFLNKWTIKSVNQNALNEAAHATMKNNSTYNSNIQIHK